MLKRLLTRIAFGLAACAIAPMAHAQNAGSLRGTVADNTGAVAARRDRDA